MAHKKGQGSSRNGRDSNPQMLGIKLFGGQTAKPGSIICRQKGTKWRPGKNVGLGRDWTIFSLIDGQVTFDQEGRRINVLPVAVAAGKSEGREWPTGTGFILAATTVSRTTPNSREAGESKHCEHSGNSQRIHRRSPGQGRV